MQEVPVNQYAIEENGMFPNNPQLPLLVYPQIFTDQNDYKEVFSNAFKENGWGGSWVNGVYDYHHYHSTSHEVLAVIKGHATLIFGGPGGKVIDVKAGDMVVIPAGVAHCCRQASEDFKVLGAYPQGQEDYDICTEKDNPEKKKSNIPKVPLPEADPVEGVNGPLMEYWIKVKEA